MDNGVVFGSVVKSSSSAKFRFLEGLDTGAGVDSGGVLSCKAVARREGDGTVASNDDTGGGFVRLILLPR